MVNIDQAKWMGFYQQLIEKGAPFPPGFPAVDQRPERLRPIPAEFPDPTLPSHSPTVTLTGHSPSERRVLFTPAQA